jgi:hypothetical protein
VRRCVVPPGHRVGRRGARPGQVRRFLVAGRVDDGLDVAAGTEEELAAPAEQLGGLVRPGPRDEWSVAPPPPTPRVNDAEIHWRAEHLERARASEAVRAERSKKSECTPGRWVDRCSSRGCRTHTGFRSAAERSSPMGLKTKRCRLSRTRPSAVNQHEGGFDCGMILRAARSLRVRRVLGGRRCFGFRPLATWLPAALCPLRVFL